MKHLYTSIFILAACVWTAMGRDTMDGIFNERVRSVQVTHHGDIFAPPVVLLGSDDFLTVSFDHLDTDREYLRWRVVRCDANWQPSSLAEIEWLDGFNQSDIDRYDFSRATNTPYVHYSFDFPNPVISPSLSGNYLIEVFSEDDPDRVWLQRRVMLSEQSAPISVQVSSQTDVDFNREHQQLSIAVETRDASVRDPFSDLKVMVAQNGRADSEVMLRHPLRLSGTTAIYEHQKPLIFPAGNEYRRFEITSTTYPGFGVDHCDYVSPYYHFVLDTDASRAGEHYIYDETQHGRFYVREYNSDESDVEADYGVVHFSLDYPEMPGWMIFIDGDLTSRRFDDASRMNYNPETGRYEKAMLLKQGGYNYQYLAVKPGASSGSTALIEGDKYQTANEYLIKVYTRGPIDRTDRLIGVTLITSTP